MDKKVGEYTKCDCTSDQRERDREKAAAAKVAEEKAAAAAKVAKEKAAAYAASPAGKAAAATAAAKAKEAAAAAAAATPAAYAAAKAKAVAAGLCPDASRCKCVLPNGMVQLTASAARKRCRGCKAGGYNVGENCFEAIFESGRPKVLQKCLKKGKWFVANSKNWQQGMSEGVGRNEAPGTCL